MGVLVTRVVGVLVGVSMLASVGAGSVPFGEHLRPLAHAGGSVDGYGSDHPFIVATSRRAGSPAGPDCPTGWLCLYDRPNFGYPRARLRSCGISLLEGWGWQGRAESMDDELVTNPNAVSEEARIGAVDFIQVTGPGDKSVDFNDVLRLDRAHRTIADLGAGRGFADLYHYCN